MRVIPQTRLGKWFATFALLGLVQDARDRAIEAAVLGDDCAVATRSVSACFKLVQDAEQLARKLWPAKE